MTEGSGRLHEAFRAAGRENRAALVAYLTAGDPDLASTVDLARALDRAGAAVLELGVPFSDPIADGPTLQRAASRALESGTTLPGVFECASEIRRRTNLALVLFSYANPLFARGFASAMREARGAGFDGVLLTDVPAEESGSFVGSVTKAGLDPVLLVSPTSPEARMKAAARLSRGFLYVISRTGTTGERRGLSPDLSATVGRARAASPGLPVAVGFGISSPSDAARVARLADGVVVGSALVSCAEKAGRRAPAALEAFAAKLSKACRR